MKLEPFQQTNQTFGNNKETILEEIDREKSSVDSLRREPNSKYTKVRHGEFSVLD